MNRIRILIGLCMFSGIVTYAQSLSLKINTDSLKIDRKTNSLVVSLTLCNKSKNDLLVYGVGSPPISVSFDLIEFCEVSSVGTGTAFALYRTTGEQEIPRIEMVDRYDRRKITDYILDSSLLVAKDHFIKSQMLLKSGAEIVFTEQISLEGFYLRKGIYYLQMVYYCGDKISNMVDVKKSNSFGNEIFRGCARSQKITITMH